MFPWCTILPVDLFGIVAHELIPDEGQLIGLHNNWFWKHVIVHELRSRSSNKVQIIHAQIREMERRFPFADPGGWHNLDSPRLMLNRVPHIPESHWNCIAFTVTISWHFDGGEFLGSKKKVGPVRHPFAIVAEAKTVVIEHVCESISHLRPRITRSLHSKLVHQYSRDPLKSGLVTLDFLDKEGAPFLVRAWKIRWQIPPLLHCKQLFQTLGALRQSMGQAIAVGQSWLQEPI